MPNLQDDTSKPLRVLHILHDLRPSGAEVMLRIAAPHFQAANIVGEILSTGTVGIGPYAPTLADVGYVIHHLPIVRSYSFFKKLRRLVRAGRYDVVHVHMEMASVWIAASVFPLTSVVRTIGSNFEFTGWLRMRRRVTRMLSRMIGVRQMAISPSVHANEMRTFGNKTEICLNWYDSDRFRPPTESERVEARKAFGLTKEDMVVVSVGNCAPGKNHKVIIEAFDKLRARGQFVYLHAGIEVDRQDERRLAINLGVDRKVRFLGVLLDVRPLLYAADVFVMPSLCEGFGNSALEALGCGVPVLLADSPGLRDYRAWFPGIQLTPPTAQDFAAKLEAFVRLPVSQHREQIEEYAVLAHSIFGVEKGVARYVAVYREMAERKAAK